MINSKLPARQDQLFNFQDKTIRTIIIDGQIWFCASDICLILGYKIPRKAVKDHIIDKDDLKKIPLKTNGGLQQVLFTNESGLYCLILSSKLSNALAFKKWVTSEVLPSIRKEGQYSVNNSLEYEEQRHQSLAIPIFTLEDFNLNSQNKDGYEKIMKEAFNFFEKAIFNLNVSDKTLAHTLIEMFSQLGRVANSAGGTERTKLTTIFVGELRRTIVELYKEKYLNEDHVRDLKNKIDLIRDLVR